MGGERSAADISLMEGAWLKLQWGANHLAAMADDIDAALNSKENTATAERQSDTRYAIRVKFGDWPLEEWSLRLGDAVHSIRGALDHAVWEIVCRQNNGPPKSKQDQRRIQFPIYDCPERFRSATVLRFVDDGTRTIFEDAQPYKAGKALNYLAALSNDDKHRLLLPGIFAWGEGDFSIRVGSNEDVASTSEPVITLHTGDMMERDAEIGYLDAEIIGDDPKVSVECQFPGFVAFQAQDGGVTIRVDTLAKLGMLVNGILDRLELNLHGLPPR